MNPPLRFKARGQMRVRIQGNSVWAQFVDLSQGAVKRNRGLLGQAINQIHIDRFKTNFPSLGHQIKNLLSGLDAMYRRLHRGIKILYAKTQAVEAQFGQKSQALGIHGAGVDFNRVFPAGHHLKVALEHLHQRHQFSVLQESRRATAQMQLTDRLTQPQMLHMQSHFARQIFQIAGGPLGMLGDDLVAGAVIAQGFTKRNVHIQAQGLGAHGQCIPSLL